MDMLPTIAHYCHVGVPNDRIIDGHDVSGILEQNISVSKTNVFYYYQKQQLQAVRWGKWKYHLSLQERIIGPHSPDTEVGVAQLYDLEADISESQNVVNKYPEVVDVFNNLISDVRYDMGDWNYEGRNQRPAGVIDEPFARLLPSN